MVTPAGPPPPIGPPPRPEPHSESKIPPGYESWEKMFAQTGHPITPQELQQVMAGITRYMTILINQQTQTMKRASQKLRDAAEGQ